MISPHLTVVIPTFNRPDSLWRAVESLFTQTIGPEAFSILIVDNAPDASARATWQALRKSAPEALSIAYESEPAAGVANARNRAMAVIENGLVAFLDDDQSAPDTWLEHLVACHQTYPAAVIFGPVLTALPDSVKEHRAYLSTFFARDPGHITGWIEKTYGCGNALLDLEQMSLERPLFDARANESGGEDDLLFARLKRRGAKFAWCEEAPVFEHPPENRLSLSYILRRAFSYGQGPCTLARRSSPPQYLTLLKWMGVGAVKFVLHGLIWLAMAIIRHPDRAFQLDKAIRGLAKVFFWVGLKFYGAATLPAASRTSTPSGRGQAPATANRDV